MVVMLQLSLLFGQPRNGFVTLSRYEKWNRHFWFKQIFEYPTKKKNPLLSKPEQLALSYRTNKLWTEHRSELSPLTFQA